ncbi:MAG: hypothetical protein CBD16_03455 [Betaproteobacteria bacterium TMED156]|nr:MAG: hypothetical protein CBD16_03455 [Betaproteobacteria bacterium TMED156]
MRIKFFFEKLLVTVIMKKNIVPRDLNVDLHMHSCASDGQLTPSELVIRAEKNKVDILALTDHDSLKGIPEAMESVSGKLMHFVTGVEISVTWANTTIHILGLNFDPFNPNLNEAMNVVKKIRFKRAQEIDKALMTNGLPSMLEEALDNAGSSGQIGRTHFARVIKSKKICPTIHDVFKSYLVPGTPGFVKHTWMSLTKALNLISEAGGLAVLAHPARYKLSPTELQALLDDFSYAGGSAIEVATGSHSKSDIQKFQTIANKNNFEASRGSDFHSPTESRFDVGNAPSLPIGSKPIWSRWI